MTGKQKMKLPHANERGMLTRGFSSDCRQLVKALWPELLHTLKWLLLSAKGVHIEEIHRLGRTVKNKIHVTYMRHFHLQCHVQSLPQPHELVVILFGKWCFSGPE